ncbi:RNA polymerase sigma factor [Gluconobacter kanchanaburiensis]|uniref:RNA polymerase sigma factor n=1 Tax=Gluconobacter kanchanaburiensis TaxID=563199 RepID=UPI00142EA3FD|nr:sigma-70 family RNA polymerase sigma factor [Gluconobacter kanchanaburiensis]MBF0862940.1 sigma-70 family RNA polymerase sigma factor [Gluconobacter kanchanaburiensis]
MEDFSDNSSGQNAKIEWLSRHIIPHEGALRGWLAQFRDIDVDDVVQECYAMLLDIETDRIRTPRAYLFRMARNVVLQSYRRARIISITALADFDTLSIMDDAPSPHDVIEARQELENLHQMVTQLPERCRQVLLLRRLEGLSQKQVSERLGISENIVEKQVARGLRALSRLFSDENRVTARPCPRSGSRGKVTTVVDR